jgi:molybdopterin-biosynthesis enzyme MoeA-like protein
MAAVADAVGRELVVDDDARERVVATAAAYREENPGTFAEYDLSFDADAWAERPAESRVVPNEAGLAPGCIVGTPDGEDGETPVYVFPGPPNELRATFGVVAGEFGGRRVSETLWTAMPEAAVTPHLDAARRRFDVTLGSYPGQDGADNRVKVTAEDREDLVEAVTWLRGRLDTVPAPDE